MKYFFIDDHEVEEIRNLARKLHQPEKFEAKAVRANRRRVLDFSKMGRFR